MKNLNLLYTKTFSVPDNAQHIALDTNTANVSYLCDGRTVWRHSPATGAVPIYNQPDSAEIVAFEHLNLNNELCIATGTGDVTVLNLQTMQSESVTFCDGGIDTMCWSPDQEIVAFVTGSKLLVVMTCNYDPIHEHSLDDAAFGDSAFITVGWGKKETQFHGTEGKQAAKQKMDIGLQRPADQLDRKISIVWRGDGEYFAVSFVGAGGRMFKVYDKEGRLQFTSEQCNGLESAINWRPSGSWIALPQILQNKYIIVLFEKNGLRHREIVMPFQATDEQIVRMAWSADSDVLAVETWSGSQSTVYLYTMANYHWYVKQTLQFDARICAFEWDTRFAEGKTLHLLMEAGAYTMFRWEYSVCHTPIYHPSNDAVVAVIDGKSILLTNFRKAVVPPPMCGEQISNAMQVNFVGFLQQSSNDSELNKMFAVTANNQFAIYKWRDSAAICSGHLVVPIEGVTGSQLHLSHWIWLTEELIVVVGTNRKSENSSTLYLLAIEKGDDLHLKEADSCTINGTIGALCPVQSVKTNGPAVVAHQTNGSVWLISIKSDKFAVPAALFDLPTFCESIIAFRPTEDADKINVFSLKYKQALHFNDRKIVADVTSMSLCRQFLAVTTLDQLQFCQLNDGQPINDRQIERGGKLIAIVPNDSRVVLQMPRGNLEAIQPRLLSLCIIGMLLDNGQYRVAFDIMRKQRINLNLLVDHNPERFLSDINRFVEEIAVANWLNLFLSDLQNIDVTGTMYASNYINRKARHDALVASKIECVCMEMCTAMTVKNDDSKYLLPIITSYVKRENIEVALALVWVLKLRETPTSSTNNDTTSAGTITSEEALKYLLYLVNVNDLYNVALGMYDFELVLFVATKSQKDPKEFLPFLNELRQYDDAYRKYRIDLHLKRYEKALAHIVCGGEERLSEALELIGQNQLYTRAMELYANSELTECYRRVVIAFAEHLRTNGKFYDACLMYERGGDLAQAILTAKHILDWQKCISLSKKLKSSEEDVQQLISSLIPALQESGNHIDAAKLLIDHQRNYNRAIHVLCDGHHYSAALYEAVLHDAELKESLIRPHLDQFTDSLTTNIRDQLELYRKHRQRLQTIRKEKELRKQFGFTGGDNDVDECDLLSDTSSMNSSRFSGSSGRTGKSHRSSKNRRKHERKLLNLKEGNPFEDIALIDALYALATISFSQQDHVRSVCKVLIEFQMDGKGSTLQRVFGELLNYIRQSLDEIWIPEMITSGQLPTDGQIDYVQYQDEQHYTLIKPHQRFKPQLNAIGWEFEALK